MWNEKQVDEYIEQEIKNATPLGKLLAGDPDKKKMYKEKLLDSGGGGGRKADCVCESCIFAAVIDPIGRQPKMRYCKIYETDDSEGKPDDVLYEGVPCEYYEGVNGND